MHDISCSSKGCLVHVWCTVQACTKFLSPVVSIFQDMENKLEDSRRQLTQLIQYTSGKAKDLVKNCIYLPSEEGCREAMRILHNRYKDPHKLLASYRKEIKEWPAVKAGDAAGFRRFLNFLAKSKSLLSQNKMNTLINNPDVMCMLLRKLPTYLQDRWNRKYTNSGTQMKGKQSFWVQLRW